MPCYFGPKGHNKQSWQFRKTHPQLRVLQKEAKAQMSFFDQIKQALHNQQTPEGTLPSTSTQKQQMTTISDLPEQISLQPRTKTAKNTFVKERHLSLDRGNSKCHGLYEGSQSGTNPERPQPSTNRGTFEAAACQPDKSDCTNIQDKETARTTRATQIYLKHKEMGTLPPFVLNKEEADLLVFNFVQSIIQQTQQHMFKQLEQCMQQAYSGLSLGTPVQAKEYTEQFKKNNNTVLLTETKRLDIATDQSEQQRGFFISRTLLISTTTTICFCRFRNITKNHYTIRPRFQRCPQKDWVSYGKYLIYSCGVWPTSGFRGSW